MAIASKNATLTKIYSVICNKILHKFFQGVATTRMCRMVFSEMGEYLACSTRGLTIYIFKLEEPAAKL